MADTVKSSLLQHKIWPRLLKMKANLIALVCLCLGGTMTVIARSIDSSSADDEQHLERRYAESTIASDISKIMDSLVQKNFVNFLLNQREKKSGPVVMAEDPEDQAFNDLLKKGMKMWVQNKEDKSKSR
ncbi:gastric inhibitory polypeptide [Brachyhypopomus gauderio]|uniref:gastric inhibitory polypeptide n=1 Tax=Brachyhypopomus gauderio TaxID=698409 RepID=UPI004040EE8C